MPVYNPPSTPIPAELQTRGYLTIGRVVWAVADEYEGAECQVYLQQGDSMFIYRTAADGPPGTLWCRVDQLLWL